MAYPSSNIGTDSDTASVLVNTLFFRNGRISIALVRLLALSFVGNRRYSTPHAHDGIDETFVFAFTCAANAFTRIPAVRQIVRAHYFYSDRRFEINNRRFTVDDVNGYVV